MRIKTFIAANVYTPVTNMINNNELNPEGITRIVITLLVYALSTTEGSVFMMKVLLGKINSKYIPNFLVEKKNRQVGAR